MYNKDYATMPLDELLKAHQRITSEYEELRQIAQTIQEYIDLHLARQSVQDWVGKETLEVLQADG